MDYQERAPRRRNIESPRSKPLRRPEIYRAIALLLALSIGGCGWTVSPPPRPAIPTLPPRIAERVVLRVNDGAVVWGGGQAGEIVRQTLIEEGAFQEVYYPVEPRNPPPLRLVIDASGKVDEEVAFGVVKSVIIGALFFLPVGIIRFNKDFTLDARVTLLDGSMELQSFTVTSATTVSATMFSDTTAYEAEARRAAFRDLGQQIIAQLRARGARPT